MAPPNFLRSDPTDISNGSPAVFVPSGAYVPEQWYDDRIFVSFARCWWPFRMLLRCEPVEGCARFHQNIPAQLLYRLSFTGGTVRACMVIWWCYWQQLCLLCGIACATLVVRALVTLPLQAWSYFRSSSSWPRMAWPCISLLSSSFVLRRIFRGPSSHILGHLFLFVGIVPHNHSMQAESCNM